MTIEKRVRALLEEQKDDYRALVDALGTAAAGTLAEMARHESARVRGAVAEAIGGCNEPGVLALATDLASDASDEVRIALARTVAATPKWDVEAEAMRRLLVDAKSEVRRDAVKAAAARGGFVEDLLPVLKDDYDWEVRQAVARGLDGADSRSVLPSLVWSLGSDEDDDVARTCAESAEKHIVVLGGYPDDLQRSRSGILGDALERVRELGRRRFPELAAWLEERIAHDIDPKKLSSLGTDLTAEAEAGRLPRAYGVEEICATVVRALAGHGSRSVVLLGESGVGKTATVQELVHRLKGRGWRVVRVSATDFLAGTVYLGEWQTKVRNLVDAARAPKRVLIYVPNLQELADAGRCISSDMNVATMLAPHIESGAIAVLGESTTDAFRRGLGKDPSLRRLFTAVEIAPATRETTRRLLEHVSAEADAALPAPVLDRLMELADFYSAGTALPGRAVGLLRRVIETCGADNLQPSDILATLCDSTGIPVEILDDAEPLDLRSVRDFLEERVMGQKEAVDAVLDVVTLIKAGLTDPEKPAGVFLFVGPTGVGKTELARALAELLFGDAGRLQRFDMSEFATYDAFERLLGESQRPGLLTSAVREQPFSVFLFDEIEKAHCNVFDLCLQIFDAGRLTDSDGKTADFTHSVIILTSNAGSAAAFEAPVGFGDAVPPPPDPAIIERRLGHTFRPEFLNRLDRIVNFLPLSEATAEKIVCRELGRVLQRSGITRRGLVVDVAPEVLALLLRRGYSRVFGARPLKRTVEKLVLLPVARAIASGAVGEDAVLCLAARGGCVAVEIVEPEPAKVAEPEPVDLAVVREHIEVLRRPADEMAEKKAALLKRSHACGFWDDRAAARRVLDEVHRLDYVLGDLARLERDIECTRHNPNPQRAAAFVSAHETEARRLDALLRGGDLGDALVTLTLVKSRGHGLNAVTRLASMYRSVGRRHRMDCDIVDQRKDTTTLAIGGAGAYALLAGESGLHLVSRKLTQPRRHEDRDWVRVDVLRAPSEERSFKSSELRVETRPLEGRLEIHMLHLESMVSVRACSADPPEKARPLLESFLRARIAGTAAAPGGPAIVRRYRLGPAPLVRDRRTGRTTGRLDRVLKGDLDAFLVPQRTLDGLAPGHA